MRWVAPNGVVGRREPIRQRQRERQQRGTARRSVHVQPPPAALPDNETLASALSSTLSFPSSSSGLLSQDATLAVAGVVAASSTPLLLRLLHQGALRHLSVEANYFSVLLPRSVMESVAPSKLDDDDGGGGRGGGGGAALPERLYARARELLSWENSWAQAAVLPLQIVLLAFTTVRFAHATGMSAVAHEVLFAKTGCICQELNLPWPAVTTAAYLLVRRVLTRSRDVIVRACADVGGAARTLEPRVETAYSTALNVASVPLGVLFLDSLGVTLGMVWGVLGVGGVAISLGIKDTVADVASGLFLMANPNFRVGDMIKAGDVRGQVMSVGATKTTLLTRTGPHKTPRTVSNHALTTGAAGIVNFAQTRSLFFDHEMRVRADAAASIAQLCVAVNEYLRSHPRVIQDPLDPSEIPRCTLRSLGPKDGVIVGIKCTLRPSPEFPQYQSEMLIDVWRLVEDTPGLRLVDDAGLHERAN